MKKIIIHFRYKSDYYKKERRLTYYSGYPCEQPINFFIDWISEEDIIYFRLYKNSKLICRKATYKGW